MLIKSALFIGFLLIGTAFVLTQFFSLFQPGRAIARFAAGIPQTDPTPSLVSGKGVWIWHLSLADSGDIGKIISRLQSSGVDWVAVKCADGTDFWTGPDECTTGMIDQFHAAGIKVFGWQYVYGDDPQGEALISNQVLNLAGIDGFIIDAEIEYYGKPTEAETYLMAIRQQHPNEFIAYSSFGNPQSHAYEYYQPTGFPYKVFGRYTDAAMPQAYWLDWQLSPTEAIDRVESEWSALYATWISQGAGESVKPVVLVGASSDFTGTTFAAPGDLTQFLTEVAARGYAGLSNWRYGKMNDEHWQEYAAPFGSGQTSVKTITDPNSYTCNQTGFIDFENFPDNTNLSTGVIGGVEFTTTDGFTWRVGDFDTGNYNGKYPNGAYTSQGTHWTWLGTAQPRGRIDFPNGPASYFSVLASAGTPVTLKAYADDVQTVLLASVGQPEQNTSTGRMDELKITRATADIHNVIIQDAGNFFVVDAICTDAPGVSSGGKFSGTVFDEGHLPVSGAFIQACQPGDLCNLTATDANGMYSVSDLGAGQFTVTAFPPGNLFPGTIVVDLALGETKSGQDLHLTGPAPLPCDATIAGNSCGSGFPTVYWGEQFPLMATGCIGGTGNYRIVLQDGTEISTGMMTENPVNSGRYTALVNPLSPNHGYAHVEITFSCSPTPVQFDIYIDPSGTVVDQNGDPVAGATVTLFRSDAASGPFTQVPDGSGIMSLVNRNNPDTTDADGRFGWDVIAGFYRVRTEKEGCTFAETEVLEIPPAVTDLRLVLECEEVPVPIPVGGKTFFFSGDSNAAAHTTESSGASTVVLAGLAGILAGAVAISLVGGWFTRRFWLERRP